MPLSEALANPTLQGLLQRAKRYGPEYNGGLSNHLPMALIALAGLGARSARLEEFFDEYAMRLEPVLHVPPEPGMTEPALGSIVEYPRWLAIMQQRIGREGRLQVLRKELARLAPGIGAAAFHGMLRTAYGVVANSDDEVAAGLAYWAARYLPLGAELLESGEVPLQAWLFQLQRQTARVTIDQPLIFLSMAEMARAAEFQRATAGLDMSSVSPQTLARLAAQRYLAGKDFTVLHLITSAHALHLLVPFADDGTALTKHYTLAYAAALALTPAGETKREGTGAMVDLPGASRAAQTSSNDHAIKLVYSCKALASTFSSDADLFGCVAELAVV